MSYTREQAEQVLKDWNNFYMGSSDLGEPDRQFLNHKFPQLPERGWVIKKNKSAIFFRTGKESGYGLIYGMWYCKDGWSFASRPEIWQPATKEEVQAMLEQEAERRGLVKGVKVKCLSDGSVYTLESLREKSSAIMNYGKIWFNDPRGYSVKIMDNGKWATPIDDLQERIDALVQEAKDKGKNLTIKID